MSGQDFDRAGHNSNPGLAKSNKISISQNVLHPPTSREKSSFVSSQLDSEDS